MERAPKHFTIRKGSDVAETGERAVREFIALANDANPGMGMLLPRCLFVLVLVLPVLPLGSDSSSV
jgi:hypothetical protein